MNIRAHETLVAWKESYQLCLKACKHAKKFPPEEQSFLTNQIRRPAYSVPGNIAEGNQKYSAKEQERYDGIKRGLLGELHCQCHFACDLGCILHDIFSIIDDRIQRVSYLIVQFRDKSSKSSQSS